MNKQTSDKDIVKTNKDSLASSLVAIGLSITVVMFSFVFCLTTIKI